MHFAPFSYFGFKTSLRNLSIILLGLLQIVFLFKAVPLIWSDGWAQDDAYISFRYAKNLINGHGLVYNIGERVEGYTNFLWTIISAIPLSLGQEDPLSFMHKVGLALFVLHILLVITVGIWAFKCDLISGAFLSLPLLYHWSFTRWAVSGMEVPLVSFLLLICCTSFLLIPKYPRAASLYAGIGSTFLLLTRPDMIFPIIALSILQLYLSWQNKTLLLEKIKFFSIPLILIYMPYILWKLWFYGSLLPNTYYAKAAYLTNYSNGWNYIYTFFTIYKLHYAFIFAVGVFFIKNKNIQHFCLACFISSASIFLYVLRLGGDFMEWRFLVPCVGILYPSLVLCGEALLIQMFQKATQIVFKSSQKYQIFAKAIFSIVIGLCLPPLTAWFTYMRTSTAKETLAKGQESIGILSRYYDKNIYNWKAVGLAIKETFPKETHIATTSAGIIPFFSDLPTLDLVGLNDAKIARVPINPENRERVGHEHVLSDYKEMRRRGVDVYLYWADWKDFPSAPAVPPDPDGFELASLQFSPGRYIDFLILDESKNFKKHAANNSRFTFFEHLKSHSKHSFFQAPDNISKRQHKIVDAIDLNDETSRSEELHNIIEHNPPNSQYVHSWHELVLPYLFDSTIILKDEGRYIFNDLSGSFSNINHKRDLYLGIRHNHNGRASYNLYINNMLISEKIELMRHPREGRWEENWVKIPPSFLLDNNNSFKLSRLLDSPDASEIFYFWFVQEQ